MVNPPQSVPDGFDQTVVSRTAQKVDTVIEGLYQIVYQLEDFKENLYTESLRAKILELQEQLLDTGDHANEIVALFQDMHSSIELLLQQRQSSKTAFRAGWMGCFNDLCSRLSPEQRESIRAILVEMRRESFDF